MQPLQGGDPRRLGGCRVLARIAVGGTTVVYFGLSRGGRPVAVKVPHARLLADPGHRERFRREITATRRAGDGYSAAAVSAEPDGRLPWLATGYLPSVTVREAVRLHGPLPPDVLRWLAAGLTAALGHVHRKGLAHNDVTPANVLLTANGPRLIDFGLAREVTADGRVPDPVPEGTIGFLPPERIADGEAGTAGDVYGLGATLAYAATGTPDGTDVADPAVAELIAAGTRADPGDRATVAELAALLAAAPDPFDGDPALPATVSDAIAERSHAPDPGDDGRRRRRLLAGLAGAAAIAAVGVVTAVVRGGGPVASVAPPPGPSSAAPTPSASASAPSRLLEFEITATGPLARLVYVVDHRATVLTDVATPWRLSLEIPPRERPTSWQIAYESPPGEVEVRVYVEGFRVVSATRGSSDTFHGEAHGRH